MPVKIIDYKQRVSESGKLFYSLTLQGGVEIVQSSSGKQYVTIRKTSMATTFDELTCQALVGQELPGSIQKVMCTPYEYTVQDTGEVITLNYRYEYFREEVQLNQHDAIGGYAVSASGLHSIGM